MIAEESCEDPLMYNLCLAMTHADIIRIKNADRLDTETLDHLLDLEKSLAKIKDHLLNQISNRNLQIMN